jgi:hypothetical protein
VLVTCKNSQIRLFEVEQTRPAVASRRPAARPHMVGASAPESAAPGHLLAIGEARSRGGELTRERCRGLGIFSLRQRGLMPGARRQPLRLGGFASTSAARLAAQSASTAAKSGADDDAYALQIPTRISASPNTEKAHLLCLCPETGRNYGRLAQPARTWADLPARDEARPGLCGTHRAGDGPAGCEPYLINFSNLPLGLGDYHLVIGNRRRLRVRLSRPPPRRQ